jgi:hypothetical protein
MVREETLRGVVRRGKRLRGGGAIEGYLTAGSAKPLSF